MDDKELKKIQADPQSILNTNSAKMEERVEEKIVTKPKMKGIIAVALAILLLIVVFVGGGVISEMQHRAQVAQEAAREIRDGEDIHNFEMMPAAENEMVGCVTELYYSQENGMHMTVSFFNNNEKACDIEHFTVVVEDRESKERIVSAGNVKIKDLTVPAGERVDVPLYVLPEHVKITDHDLDFINVKVDMRRDFHE